MVLWRCEAGAGLTSGCLSGGTTGTCHFDLEGFETGIHKKAGSGSLEVGCGCGCLWGSFWKWRDSERGMMHEGVRVDVGSKVSKAVPDQAFGLRSGLEDLQ